jgi:hypothetical protein
MEWYPENSVDRTGPEKLTAGDSVKESIFVSINLAF